MVRIARTIFSGVKIPISGIDLIKLIIPRFPPFASTILHPTMNPTTREITHVKSWRKPAARIPSILPNTSACGLTDTSIVSISLDSFSITTFCAMLFPYIRITIYITNIVT